MYLPGNRTFPAWECTALSVGYTRVQPGSPYPPYRHPMDHHFNWANGRILHSYTIVFITEGGGIFESASLPRKQRVEPGTVFIVFPEIWHRYTPNPDTGWVEHWVECSGRAFDQAQSVGLLRPEKPVLRIGLDPDVLHCFEQCHSWAQRACPGKQSVLSTLCLQLLAILEQVQDTRGRGQGQRKIDEIVQQAQGLISQQCQERLNIQKLAHHLHVGYSQFRQAFRKQTGLSPKQYHTRVRLEKAQDFLANTSKSIKEIAELLGFDSPFHLSNQFKARRGVSPQAWRLRLNGNRSPEA